MMRGRQSRHFCDIAAICFLISPYAISRKVLWRGRFTAMTLLVINLKLPLLSFIEERLSLFIILYFDSLFEMRIIAMKIFRLASRRFLLYMEETFISTKIAARVTVGRDIFFLLISFNAKFPDYHCFSFLLKLTLVTFYLLRRLYTYI